LKNYAKRIKMKINKNPSIPLHQLKNQKMKKETPAIVEPSTPLSTNKEGIPVFDWVVLWFQDKKGNPSRPSLKGFVNKPDGSRMEIVLWDVISERGTPYFKGRIMPERKPQQEQVNEQKPNEESAPY
jgi:hypothetical protein